MKWQKTLAAGTLAVCSLALFTGCGADEQAQLLEEAAAKEAVLNHAGLEAGGVDFTKFELDTENGRQIYDIEFVQGDTGYEYDIDALTGEIITYEKETSVPLKPSEPAEAASGSIISREEAESAALKHAGLNKDDVVFTKTELDTADDKNERDKYELEFQYNGMEYEYDIDALTGEVLSHSQEKDD